MSNDPNNPYGVPPAAPPPAAAPTPAMPPPGPAPSNTGWAAPPGQAPQPGWQAPPPGGTPPGGGWNPPPGAAHAGPAGGNNKAGCGKIALILLVVGLIGFGGLLGVAFMLPGTGEAEFTALDLVQPTGHTAYVDFTWVVHELPENADDATDIVITLESEAFEGGELVFDWAYLAQKDDVPETTPDAPPPIKTPMSLRILVERDLVDQVWLYDNERLKLHARLEWDGSRKARRSIDITQLYNE